MQKIPFHLLSSIMSQLQYLSKENQYDIFSMAFSHNRSTELHKGLRPKCTWYGGWVWTVWTVNFDDGFMWKQRHYHYDAWLKTAASGVVFINLGEQISPWIPGEPLKLFLTLDLILNQLISTLKNLTQLDSVCLLWVCNHLIIAPWTLFNCSNMILRACVSMSWLQTYPINTV